LGPSSVGCGDNANVDFAGGVLAHALELPFLQNSQQFGLVCQWNITDFVEKQRSAIGELKPPDAIAQGTRECALCVTEELTQKAPMGQIRS
jgi:hypothetical protein